MNKTETFIEKAKKIHGETYDYSKFHYVNNVTKSVIVCKKHGEFIQTAQLHLRGSGCVTCHRESQFLSNDTFLDKCKKVHGDLYDYSITHYKSSDHKIDVICKKHGKFTQYPQDHLRGHGCFVCAHKIAYTTQEFIDKCKIIHGDKYDFSDSKYLKNNIKTTVKCLKHGDFQITPNALFSGYGCYKCGRENAAKNTKKSSSQFINQSKDIHGDKYDYSMTDYTHSTQYVDIVCKKHGIFTQIANNHTQGFGCYKCSKENFQSGPEHEIKGYIESIGETVIQTKYINKVELDLFVPNKNIAIEFDGIFYHSSGSIDTDLKMKKKHLDKTKFCEERGIQLLHIFENEWNEKKEIWKSIIKNKLGKSNKIYARKTSIVEVPISEAKKFCEKNHMQGFISGKYYYGLIDKSNNLVCLMIIGVPRYTKASYEILRFCSILEYTVVGGFSKIINQFIKTHSGNLISYANRRWSNGKLYESTGFIKLRYTEPCYYYIKNNVMYHRSKFMKHKLKNIIEHFDSNLTEVQNMYNAKYRRIWDCGNIVYELKIFDK